MLPILVFEGFDGTGCLWDLLRDVFNVLHHCISYRCLVDSQKQHWESKGKAPTDGFLSVFLSNTQAESGVPEDLLDRLLQQKREMPSKHASRERVNSSGAAEQKNLWGKLQNWLKSRIQLNQWVPCGRLCWWSSWDSVEHKWRMLQCWLAALLCFVSACCECCVLENASFLFDTSASFIFWVAIVILWICRSSCYTLEFWWFRSWFICLWLMQLVMP